MSRSPNAPRFDRRPAKPTLHPRRVVGGVRMQVRVAPTTVEASATYPGWTWASARWLRLAESLAPGEQFAEGLEYAQAGQTRTIEIRPGVISARVQGRLPAAYKTSLRLATFTHEQWEQVIAAMTRQARYGAAVLSGELPANIEDLFAPHGLRLFPADAADLSPSCNCSVFTGIEPGAGGSLGRATAATGSIPPPLPSSPAVGAPGVRRPGVPWCKHVCCLMYLVAERLGTHPLLMLSLRGMDEADLVERLRQARALAGMQRGAGGAGGMGGAGEGDEVAAGAPVYTPHVPLTERSDRALEESVHDFWRAPVPEALAELDLPIAPPEVSHPLLRRLGASPFAGAKFPLVGLLATCYDVIGRAAVEGAGGTGGAGGDAPEKGEAEGGEV